MFSSPKPWKYWENNQTLRNAVKIVIKGGSYGRATRETGVAYQLIRKFYVENVLKPGLKDIFRQNLSLLDVKEDDKFKDDKVNCTVFTSEQDMVLLKCIETCERLFYGLSSKEIQILAYQMVVNEDLKIPEGWQNGFASNEWFVAFKKRHRSVMNNIKKPDLTMHIGSKRYFKTYFDQINLGKLIWEKKLVNDFYDNIETVFKQHPGLLKNNRVFNLDETYVDIPSCPGERLKDRDSKLDIITVCCVICADGSSFPPVIVKPYQDNEQSRANEFVASRGRLTYNLFIEVMQFFVKYSCSSPSNPSILIMDSDICHFSSAALNLANDSGVFVVTVHPHLNFLLQPLNGEIFDSFNKNYYEHFDLSALKQPSLLDIGKIVDEAWAKAATPESIANAFKKCGLSPYDRDLFTDNEYARCIQKATICYECRAREGLSRSVQKKAEVNNDDEVPEDKEPSKETPEGEAETSSCKDVAAPVENKTSEGDSANMPKSASAPSQDLDKLKRRLIRSIARLIKEKKTEAEVWTQLKKECGANCKTLWLRMRSLTLKKLKRLLDADDRVENVPAVARMTLTDWLLYDLVLVHEKIDVINRGSPQDSRVLENLFALVQRFEIEGRQGDDLAEAWTAATVDYNRKGHQCSPMLMQRRWFQLMELTRHKLYKFWFTYRGHEKKLDQAKADPPTPLQRAISLRYPAIVTAPFPTWDERIEQKLVIMPEEFEVKMRRKVHMKPTDEAVPDVVIVEKKIDTITIDSDSDFAEGENMQDPETNEPQTPIIVQVKTEPPDMESSIDITEHPVQPDKFLQAIERLEYEEDRIVSHDNATAGEPISETAMPYITNVQGASSNEANIVNQNIQSQTTVEETDIEIVDSKSQESILIDDDDDDVSLNQTPDERKTNTKLPSENFTKVPRPAANINSYEKDRNVFPVYNTTEEMFPIITSVAGGSQVQAKLEISANLDEEQETVYDEPMNYDEQDDIITIVPETEKSHIDIAREIVLEANYNDNGIEFADDGIEESDQNEFNESDEGPENQRSDVEETGAPKFDLKLLMTPVVYTTKLDNMTVYKGKSVYEPICQKELVSKIIIESKPVSVNTVNVEQIKADNQLLEAENSQEQVENAQDFDDNLFQNETSNDEDKFIDSKRVKLTSSLLKRPKIKSYHPIQLCKNPDFNMRLKRLTMGFFSHERNRMLLRACKPMTIDLSKAFESKLVDGTMYLKPSDTAAVKIEVKDEINEPVPVTVQPYAGPVKSLVENPDVDKILRQELRKRIIERNKTISLPNISVVRQINQNLLMAEVAPMVVQAEKPTNIMTVQDLIETVVEGNHTEPNPLPVISTNKPKANTCAKNTNPAVSMNMPKANTSASNPPINPMNMPKVNQPVMNTEKAKEVSTQQKLLDNLSTPVLPMMQTKSNDNINTEKQKKKNNQADGKRPSWLTRIGHPHVIPEDALLTLDTLYKVLSTLDPTSVPNYKLAKKKQSQVAKQAEIEKAEAEITDLTVESCDNINVESAASDTRNIHSQKPRKREDFCCWANMKTAKLTTDARIRLGKHRCKIRCKCCCREQLRQAEIESEIKILQKMQSRDRDTYLETIEQVVQQSRDNQSQVTSPSVVTTDSTQPNTPQEVSQAGPLSNEPTSANTEQHTELATSSKTREVTMAIDLEDEDDQGNDVYMSEPEPTNNEVINDQPPKPAIRVFSGRPYEDPRMENLSRGRGRPSHLGRPSTSLAKEDGTPSAPFLIPVETVQQPIMPEPLVTLEQPVETTHTGSSVSSNINKIKNTPVVKQQRIKLRRVPAVNSHDLGEEEIACTCRPNVAQDKQSPMLVVDGIGGCKRHTSSRVSKETRIYLSRKHLTSEKRPFFVGKDKILLTNIKPPRLQKAADPVLTSSITQSQPLPDPANKSEPVMLDLPAGVQVIILPDGNVSYVLEPDTKLTSKELENMKVILQIVQVQVNAKGYTLPLYDSPLADISDDITNSNNEEIYAPVSDQLASESIDKDRVNDIDSETSKSRDGQNVTPKCGDTLNDNVSIEKHLSSFNEETPIMNDITKKTTGLNKERENTSEVSEIDNNINDTTTGSRNLLSDLMEMSGILDDDVNSIQSEISVEQTDQTTVANQLTTNEQPRPQSPVHQISAEFNKTTYDLTPIVSFSDLKYACENKGLFFKLDLNTGLIVAINVCIQKTGDVGSKMRATEVIDLTEEQNESMNEIKDTSDYQGAIESIDNQSKTGNVYLMSKKNPTRVTNILQRKLDTIKKFNTLRVLKLSQTQSGRSLLKKNIIRQRKQTFRDTNNKVASVIDMVHSDAPMEEEYLEQSSDDSDNEPLAKVAKKMRDIETSQHNKAESRETLNVPDQALTGTDESIVESADVTGEPKEAIVDTNEAIPEPSGAVNKVSDTVNEEALNESGDSMDIDDSLNFEAAIHAVEIPVNTSAEEQRSNNQKPVPTQLMLSGPTVSQPILLNDAFLNEDEESQDDCILGV